MAAWSGTSQSSARSSSHSSGTTRQTAKKKAWKKPSAAAGARELVYGSAAPMLTSECRVRASSPSSAPARPPMRTEKVSTHAPHSIVRAHAPSSSAIASCVRWCSTRGAPSAHGRRKR